MHEWHLTFKSLWNKFAGILYSHANGTWSPVYSAVWAQASYWESAKSNSTKLDKKLSRIMHFHYLNQVLGCNYLEKVALGAIGAFLTQSSEFLLVLGLGCYCCEILWIR